MSEVVKQARPPYPRGIDLVKAGECPRGMSNLLTCWRCLMGHATECHHPMDCETANCGHYRQAQALEEKHRGD